MSSKGHSDLLQLWISKRNTRPKGLAVMMATHSRLGADSLLRSVGEDVLRMIVGYTQCPLDPEVSAVLHAYMNVGKAGFLPRHGTSGGRFVYDCMEKAHKIIFKKIWPKLSTKSPESLAPLCTLYRELMRNVSQARGVNGTYMNMHALGAIVSKVYKPGESHAVIKNPPFRTPEEKILTNQIITRMRESQIWECLDDAYVDVEYGEDLPLPEDDVLDQLDGDSLVEAQEDEVRTHFKGIDWIGTWEQDYGVVMLLPCEKSCKIYSGD